MVQCVFIFIIRSYKVHKRVIKPKSMSNKRDFEPFCTKINSSTALAAATTRGSHLQKTRANKTVVTQQKYQMCKSQICYYRAKHLIQLVPCGQPLCHS